MAGVSVRRRGAGDPEATFEPERSVAGLRVVRRRGAGDPEATTGHFSQTGGGSLLSPVGGRGPDRLRLPSPGIVAPRAGRHA